MTMFTTTDHHEPPDWACARALVVACGVCAGVAGTCGAGAAAAAVVGAAVVGVAVVGAAAAGEDGEAAAGAGATPAARDARVVVAGALDGVTTVPVDPSGVIDVGAVASS